MSKKTIERQILSTHQNCVDSILHANSYHNVETIYVHTRVTWDYSIVIY